jgi:hypothetical protein
MGEAAYPQSDATGAAAAAVSGKSAVSWPAIIAGAFIAIATSLILLALGSGLGFATMSPGSEHGFLGTTFVVTAAIWLIMTQWISAGLGGYVAGRLRTRWYGTHTHEIFFRDTAHGLVTWAVATVVIAALIGPSVRSVIAGGAQPASVIAQHVTIFADSDQSTSDRLIGAYSILGNTLATGSLPIVDRIYTSGADAAKAGVHGSESAREAAAQAGIYAAFSLLIGAFTASVAAALGGRFRDEHL